MRHIDAEIAIGQHISYFHVVWIAQKAVLCVDFGASTELLAFLRRHRDKGVERTLLIAVTLSRGRELVEAGGRRLDWWGTDIVLPEGCDGPWDDVLDGEAGSSEREGRTVLPARTLMGNLPVAVLKRSIAIDAQEAGLAPDLSRPERIAD